MAERSSYVTEQNFFSNIAAENMSMVSLAIRWRLEIRWRSNLSPPSPQYQDGLSRYEIAIIDIRPHPVSI